MSCCGNHNHGNQHNGNNNEDHGMSKKHSLLMKLCCIVPIVLVAVLLIANTVKGASGNLLTYGLLLLCPLSHLVLMPLMMRNRKH